MGDNSADKLGVICDGIPRRGMTGAERQARYRERRLRLGIVAVTVEVPAHSAPDVYLAAEALRQAKASLPRTATRSSFRQVGLLEVGAQGPKGYRLMGPGEDILEEFEVYDGRRRLGHVVVQAAQWVAANDDNQIIGRYQSRKAAISAIRDSAGRTR